MIRDRKSIHTTKFCLREIGYKFLFLNFFFLTLRSLRSKVARTELYIRSCGNISFGAITVWSLGEELGAFLFCSLRIICK